MKEYLDNLGSTNGILIPWKVSGRYIELDSDVAFENQDKKVVDFFYFLLSDVRKRGFKNLHDMILFDARNED